MCGIIGYIGEQNASFIILDGLKRLEYRGYDSAGLAVLHKGYIQCHRAKGKIFELEKAIQKKPISGNIGIGHTRWATHGRPSDENAHPHIVGRVAIVHNGIIENYLELKEELIREGRRFSSETDSEVIAHLLDRFLRGGASVERAIKGTISCLKGSYAVLVLDSENPDKLIAFKKGSPLIIGLGNGENFVASDIPALINYTRKVIPLEDGEYALVEKGSFAIKDLKGRTVDRRPVEIPWTPAMAEKAGFKHFMLKEIFEQPRALAETITGRVKLETGEVRFEETVFEEGWVQRLKRIVLSGCGTAFHAGLVGKYLLERFLRVPVEAEVASELRYRDPMLDSNTLMILISQSGETADTLAMLEEAKRKKAFVLSICNVMDSTLARRSDAVIYTRAGPEIGVASTKAFSTQLAVLYLLANHLAGLKGLISKSKRRELLIELLQVPGLVEGLLEGDPMMEEIAYRYYRSRGFFYIGRGINYPIALEGALKLKEISYIHAEPYPAGELKHGPIALIDHSVPVVALSPSDALFPKMLSNIEEVRAREGKVIALINPEAERTMRGKADELVLVPKLSPELEPILLVVPLQLLAYHIAVLNGTDVDQPRNLAKSVTVE